MSFFMSAKEAAAVYKTKLAEEAIRVAAEEEECRRRAEAYVPLTPEEERRQWEETMAIVQKREADRQAAYPAEFAAALAEYMTYLRSLVKEAIQEASVSVSRYAVNTPQTALHISMESFRREPGAGCCGEFDGDPAHLRWEKKDGLNHFDARNFFDKSVYSYKEMGLTGPVDQLKAELEPLGYTVNETYEGFQITIPLA
jgi:hypothetical protein